MKKEEHLPGAYAAAIVASASTIGPIIPPGIPMVIYGLMAGVSVGNLFLGGFVPGFLMGGTLMVMIYIIAKKRGYPSEPRASFREMLLALKTGFFPLLMPLIILGGIIFGLFTPTEAAAVAVTYGFIVGGLIYKELKWKDLPGHPPQVGLADSRRYDHYCVCLLLWLADGSGAVADHGGQIHRGFFCQPLGDPAGYQYLPALRGNGHGDPGSDADLDPRTGSDNDGIGHLSLTFWLNHGPQSHDRTAYAPRSDVSLCSDGNFR